MGQWFAIFDGTTGSLTSVGDSVTFPLGTGLRAVTVDGPQNGRFWDKGTLNFVTTPPPPPPPPPPVDPFPYRQEWGTATFVFGGKGTSAATVTFPPGKFTVPPIVTSPVNVRATAAYDMYLSFQVASVTKDGFVLYARSPAVITSIETATWHAVQRYKESA